MWAHGAMFAYITIIIISRVHPFSAQTFESSCPGRDHVLYQRGDNLVGLAGCSMFV